MKNIKTFTEFLEGKDHSINIPNNIDNISGNKKLDKNFIRVNKEKPPVADTDPPIVDLDDIAKSDEMEHEDSLTLSDIKQSISKTREVFNIYELYDPEKKGEHLERVITDIKKLRKNAKSDLAVEIYTSAITYLTLYITITKEKQMQQLVKSNNRILNAYKLRHETQTDVDDALDTYYMVITEFK